MITDRKTLYSLIPLEDFKAVLDIDDREDKLARFCLVTGTFTIEQYCKRRFLRKTIHQVFREWGDLTLFLSEYPVREILAVSVLGNGEILEPELYCLEPLDEIENIPCQLILSPALKRMRGITALKVIYKAGYASGKVPPDLASACLELASWNMSRYRGRRVGMTGNIKGAGKEGEHFEMSMPENVRTLLEPYRRKTI
jgi:uncharacterized phiE125 gp8 family phage protein